MRHEEKANRHHAHHAQHAHHAGRIKPLNFLFLTVAGFVNAIGVALFLTPLQLIDGGFSGTSFVIFHLTDIPMFVWLLALNTPFFLLAWKKLGINVVIYSLYAIAMYSLAMFLYQQVFKLCGPDAMQSPVIKNDYDMILAAIFGGLISGVGSGLTIRFGGAMDGVEVMGVMFAKRMGVTVGQFVMGYNVVLYTVAGVLLGQFQTPLYSIVAYAVGLKAVDFIVDGLDKGKAATIITDNATEVAQGLSEVMGCSVTMLKAKGYYSQEIKGMLYCVVNRFEIGELKHIVSEIDPRAFVSINEVSDTMSTTANIRFKSSSKKKRSRVAAARAYANADTAPETGDTGSAIPVLYDDAMDTGAAEAETADTPSEECSSEEKRME